MMYLVRLSIGSPPFHAQHAAEIRPRAQLGHEICPHFEHSWAHCHSLCLASIQVWSSLLHRACSRVQARCEVAFTTYSPFGAEMSEMAAFAGMSIPQRPLVHHSASAHRNSISAHRVRAHLRTSRMRCVAAAPSTMDSKPRPGEKKGMSGERHVLLLLLVVANHSLLLE